MDCRLAHMDDEKPPEDAADAAPAFRKPFKRGNKSTMRSKTVTEDPAQNDASEVIRPNKVAKPNPLNVSTKRDPASTSGAVQETLAHGSDRRIAQFDNKAFAQNEQETDRKYDAQSQYEAAKKMWSDGGDVAADGSKIYRGQMAYRQYTSKSESFDSQVLSGAGPARAPVHYRATALFDYKPDLCKDYKETGYCGFGDSCKFLHDRSDYKSGWQLEKQWEEQQREKAHQDALKAAGMGEECQEVAGGGAGSSEEDKLPFACLICREPWHPKSNPVVTKCEHYFCESCALKHAAKTKRCFVCAENTNGIFNTCKVLAEKIERQRKQEEALRDVEAGGEQSDEALLKEYEEHTKKARRMEGGWGIV